MHIVSCLLLDFSFIDFVSQIWILDLIFPATSEWRILSQCVVERFYLRMIRVSYMHSSGSGTN